MGQLRRDYRVESVALNWSGPSREDAFGNRHGLRLRRTSQCRWCNHRALPYRYPLWVQTTYQPVGCILSTTVIVVTRSRAICNGYRLKREKRLSRVLTFAEGESQRMAKDNFNASGS